MKRKKIVGISIIMASLMVVSIFAIGSESMLGKEKLVNNLTC